MKWLGDVVGLVLCVAFMTGVYFGGRHDGRAQGLSECHDASLQSQLKAANAERDNLKAQLANQASALKDSDAAKQAIAADLARAQSEVQAIRFPVHCLFPKAAVALLNREGGQ